MNAWTGASERGHWPHCKKVPLFGQNLLSGTFCVGGRSEVVLLFVHLHLFHLPQVSMSADNNNNNNRKP